MNNLLRKTQLLFAALGAIGTAFAGAPPDSSVPPGGTPPKPYNSNSITVNPNCLVGTSQADLDINNVRARYMNAGDMFWDRGASLPRYEVPKRTDNTTTSKHSMFAAAIWIGGVEQGTDNLVVMVQTYRQGERNYWPGPIQYSDNTKPIPTKASICAAWDQHFKCNRRTVKEFVDLLNSGKIPNESDIPNEIKLWPGRGNPFLKRKSEFASDPDARASIDNNLANFFDNDNNGIYNPLAGDYPLWAGTEKDTECEGTEININAGADQVLWWVCNDAGNVKNFSTNTTPIPAIGMEVHYEAFAYASTDATNDMTFLRQRLYNKGSYIMGNTYLAQWADPDLGNPNDDYVGCDVMRGLGICYNGDDNDEGQSGYGLNPPAVGVDFFRGPFPDDKFDAIDWNLNCRGPQSTQPDTNERIVMSGFMYYNNCAGGRNCNPTKAADYYNYLQNKWTDGNEVSFGGQGLDPVGPGKSKAIFMFPNVTASSDPYGFACGNTGCEPRSCGPVWNENTSNNAPGDRRFLANNGPFTLKPGSFNECTIGIVWARATSGGATGSFGKLLAADDLAQERFDECFKRNVGPNNPNLEIVEDDKYLVFTIIPDTIVRAQGTSQLMTTESYTERNRKVSTGNDLFYRFQGYKLYQLADDRVSVQELDNPDRARPLQGDADGDGENDINGIMDIRDGVTSISSLEYNATLDALIQTPKVRSSPDKGIFNSFKVSKDAFASTGLGGMSNFKKYYFAVIAYGYHNNTDAKTPYIQGVENYKIYTAIPHIAKPEAFGTTIPLNFGSGFEITKLAGTGNSGNQIELKPGIEDQIVTQGKVDRLVYSKENSPIDIKVYNQKALRGGKFQVKLSSRLRYSTDRSNYVFQIGDEIWANPNLVFEKGHKLNQRIGFKQGKAIVRRILKVNELANTFDLDIDLLCHDDSISGGAGSFSYFQDSVSTSRGDVLESRIKSTCDFFLASDPSKTAKGDDFVAYDYWRINFVNNPNIPTVYSQKPVSAVSEQLLPEYGISVRLKRGINPGSDPLDPLSLNGALYSEVELDPNPLKLWLFPTPAAEYGWIRSDAGAFDQGYYALDPKRGFATFGGGAWIPYVLTESSLALKPGPQVPGTNDGSRAFENTKSTTLQAMTKCGNVDVVFTADKSKWTRCVVLQTDSVGASSTLRPKYVYTKSRVPSVNIDYQDDPTAVSPYSGQRSRGVSWFPGYAVDLDRGVRLNMMFSESIVEDSAGGNDLKYDPIINYKTRVSDGSRNFIYVLNSPYDQAKSTERALDSIAANFLSLSVPNYLTRYRNWNVQNIMYTGLMGRIPDFVTGRPQPLNNSPVRIKLRVERAFQSYLPTGPGCEDGNPLFEFDIPEPGTIRNDLAVGKNALDLIRVVPNPYLSLSSYENGQIDNRVKIVNLPSQCVISIFNLTGTLVRQFNFDQSSSKPYAANRNGELVTNSRGANYQTFLDWDLKNQNGIPIASGVYLIHIKSDQLGEKTLKWFGVLRPIDLDSFN